MSNSCLGIYVDNNYIKYAKLTRNNNGQQPELKKYGVMFVNQNINETILKIISETDSKEDMIVSNARDVHYSEVQVFKQISSADLKNIVNLEFEDWCEKFTFPSTDGLYTYYISDLAIGDYRKGMLAIASKNSLEANLSIGEIKISSIYPTEMLMTSLVPEENKNYILVNFDKQLFITVVSNGKMLYESIHDIGMSQILDRFADILGSYPKAYDACKQINVFNEGADSAGRVKLEEIVEPILQEVLQKVGAEVAKNKEAISKIFVTGMCTLFTNVDTLFTEYFNVKCDILKPKLLSEARDVRNIAEMLECIQPMVLAEEAMLQQNKQLDFTRRIQKTPINILDSFKKSFKKNKEQGVTSQGVITAVKANKLDPHAILTSVTRYMMYPLIIGTVLLAGYLVTSNMYLNILSDMQSKVDGKINAFNTQNQKILMDINSINSAKTQYKTVNDEVNKLIKEIETAQINKYSTYQIASFMQKMIKVIPSNVTLVTISSSDNKKIKIVAKANSYQDLGYFVASLRLKPDILKNITVSNIQNGDTVSVEIGGELP